MSRHEVSRHVALVVAATIAAILCGSPAVYPVPLHPRAVPPARILAGERLFTQDCVMCHGDRGAGDGELASSLAERAGWPLRLGDLARRDSLDRLGRAAVRRTISSGGAHEGLSTLMPPWGRQLTTQEVDDLTDYIMQLPGTPAGMDRGLLAAYLKADPGVADEGQVVYMHQCAVCHGRTGQGDGPLAKGIHRRHGVVTTDLTDAKVMSAHGDRELFVVIAAGGEAGELSAGMPYWRGHLTPDRINDVIAYVRRISEPHPTP